MVLSGNTPTIITTVYHPPQVTQWLFKCFAALLTHLSTLSPNITLLGIFNIQMENSHLPLTRGSSSCLQSFGLNHFVDFPTLKVILWTFCCSGLTPSICTADDLQITDYSLITFSATLGFSITRHPASSHFRILRTSIWIPSTPLLTICQLLSVFPPLMIWFVITIIALPTF